MSKKLSKEQEALAWMEAVIDEGYIFKDGLFINAVGPILEDGVYLLKLMSKLHAETSQPNFENSESESTSDKQRIELFLERCRECGMRETELFESSDLVGGDNVLAVVRTIRVIKERFEDNVKSTVLPKARGRLDTPHPITYAT